jgi:hypothetical protein
MPPAVGRLRYVLPVTGSSAPGAPLSRGQASFAIRITQIWWLSPFHHLFTRITQIWWLSPFHHLFTRITQIWWLSPFSRDTNATVDSAGRKPAATSGNLRSRKKRRRGRHPRGCRPRLGACVTFFLSPGLPLPEPRIARPGVVRKGRPLDHQGFARFGGCHLFPQLAVASPAVSRFRRSFRRRQAPRAAPMPATNTMCVGSGTEKIWTVSPVSSVKDLFSTGDA